MMRQAIWPSFMLCMLLLCACSPSAPSGAEAGSGSGEVSFSNDVLPILESRCASCHGVNQTQAGLSLTSYSALMAGSSRGPVVAPGDAESSLIVELVRGGQMPKGGPRLTPNQVQLLVDWINQGALDN
jgi:mono/diheme cytochrome c family protein